MQSSHEQHVRVISQDYDGFTSSGFTLQYPSFRRNWTLIEWFAEQDKMDPAHLTLYTNGSLRQDVHLDVHNSFYNNVGYCFDSLPSFIQNFSAITGIPAHFDPILTPDIRHKKPSGHTFNAACQLYNQNRYSFYQPDFGSMDLLFSPRIPIDKIERRQDLQRRLKELQPLLKNQLSAFADKTKISLLYLQLQRVANKYRNKRITFIFGDNEIGILNELKEFLNVYPQCFPPNINKLLLVLWSSLPKSELQQPVILHTITPTAKAVLDECYPVNYIKLCTLFLKPNGACDLSDWRTETLEKKEGSNKIIDHFINTREVASSAMLTQFPSPTRDIEHHYLDIKIIRLNAMLRLLFAFKDTIHQLNPQRAEQHFVWPRLNNLKEMNVIEKQEIIEEIFDQAYCYLRDYNGSQIGRLLNNFIFGNASSQLSVPVQITQLLGKFEAVKQGKIDSHCDARLLRSLNNEQMVTQMTIPAPSI